jgi:hypothetical protein
MNKLPVIGSPSRCGWCKEKPTRELHIFIDREQCEQEIWCCEYHFEIVNKGDRFRLRAPGAA